MDKEGCGVPDVEWLTALNEDEIDYSILSDDVLTRLATGVEPYIATSAVGELGRRHSPVAGIVASRILKTTSSDQYLSAAALGVLFEIDRDAAVEYMRSNVSSCDPYVLNEMLKCMIADELFFRTEPMLSLLQAAGARVRSVAPEERFPTDDLRELFFGVHGN